MIFKIRKRRSDFFVRKSKEEKRKQELAEGLFQPYDFNINRSGVFVWIIIVVLVVLGLATLFIARMV